MRVRDKNPVLKKLITDFGKKDHEKGIWKALAEGLNRPRNRGYEVNLDRLERFAKAKETIVVPGCVLGKGELSKPLSVFALRFSESARQKIGKAGGKCMDICEIDEKAASKARIMG